MEKKKNRIQGSWDQSHFVISDEQWVSLLFQKGTGEGDRLYGKEKDRKTNKDESSVFS